MKFLRLEALFFLLLAAPAARLLKATCPNACLRLPKLIGTIVQAF